jgi:hypothetical protein
LLPDEVGGRRSGRRNLDAKTSLIASTTQAIIEALNHPTTRRQLIIATRIRTSSDFILWGGISLM